MEKLTIIATLIARPGKEEALGVALGALVAPSRAEAGNINYDLHRSKNDSGTWVVYENWKSDEALEFHVKTPHFIAFAARLEELTESGVQLQRLTMVSEPGDTTA